MLQNWEENRQHLTLRRTLAGKRRDVIYVAQDFIFGDQPDSKCQGDSVKNERSIFGDQPDSNDEGDNAEKDRIIIGDQSVSEDQRDAVERMLSLLD